ncbi:MAG: DUF6259 domain-containing protein [Chitinophagaceae bacterium]|nr:DUF6259 domain-containing protein [Chitinophagaceae bacterium]
MKTCFILILLTAFYIAPVYSDQAAVPKEYVVIENDFIRFKFSGQDGALIAFTDLAASSEFLANDISFSPWKIKVEKNGISQTIDINSAGAFVFNKMDSKTVRFEWSDFSMLKNEAFKVAVTVKMEATSSLSNWNIGVSGMEGEKLEHVVFPNIEYLKDMGNEELALPSWMGELVNNPRGDKEGGLKTYILDYPGLMSMQFLALYNKESYGLYAAADDTLGYSKQFVLKTDRDRYLNYHIVNFPASDTALKSYVLPYNGIIGSFKGDWISAAGIYKEWGTKQRWSKESRFRNSSDNSWVEKTALWVWNRGKSDNVLLPAKQLAKKLGLPVNVFWHWWHSGAYDDGFPEYFPPREGLASFKAALSAAQEEGVRAIVYLNSYQWGTSTKSFEKEGAVQWAVRDINGKTQEHVYNIFTQNSLTPMCVATTYWKNKYLSLAGRAFGECNVNGIYMDQACINFKCYSLTHDHPVGGGNYWVKNFGDLTEKIRSGNYFDPDKMLAGEGAGENWLPYLNAMLTLQASKERYAGVQGSETIPLFQAVYHQYGITFGSYSSLVTPPYDNLWPEKYAPKDPEHLLDASFNEQFLMEQARSFVWGMQPTIANYHEFLLSERSREMNYLSELVWLRYKVLPYLLYGEFIRPPFIIAPEKTIPVSRLSIYAGQGNQVKSFEKKVPLLYTSAWKSDKNRLGVAIAGINPDSTRVKFEWDISSYALPPKGRVYLITSKERKLLKTYHNNKISVDFMLAPDGICFLEIIPGS